MKELNVFSSDVLLNILPKTISLITHSRSINPLNQMFFIHFLFHSFDISDVDINVKWFGSYKLGTREYNNFLETNLMLPEKIQFFSSYITLSLLGMSYHLMSNSYRSHSYFKKALSAKNNDVGVNINYIISKFYANKISLIDVSSELEKHININDSGAYYNLLIYYNKAVMYFKNCIRKDFLDDESIKLINYNIDKLIENVDVNHQFFLKAKFLKISLLFFIDKYSNKEEMIKILNSLEEGIFGESINFLKCWIYYEVGDFTAALEGIKLCNSERKNSLDTMLLFVTAYAKTGNLTKMENLIEHVERLVGQSTGFSELIFLCKIYLDYVKKNYCELLVKLDDKKTEQFSDESFTKQFEIFRGLSYLKLEKQEEAYKILSNVLDADDFFIKPILALDKKNIIALTYRAHLYNKKGLYVEALNCLDVVFDKSYIPSLIENVISLYGLNKLEEANKFLDILKELNFFEYRLDFVPYISADVGKIPLLVAIRVKCGIGRYEESLELWEKLNNFSLPNVYVVYIDKYVIQLERAFILLKARRFDEALKFCEKLLQENPQNAFQFQQIKLDIFLNKSEPEYENSIDYCSQLIKTDKVNRASWLYRMGCILSAIGNYEEAIDYYNKAISMIPTYPTCDHLSIMYAKARALYIEGDYNESFRLCNQAIELALTNRFESKEFWLMKGQILFTKNRYEEAIDCYKQSLLIKDDFMPALEKILFAYIFQKNKQKANLYMEKLKYLCKNKIDIISSLLLLVSLYEYVFNENKEINKVFLELRKLFEESKFYNISYKFLVYEMMVKFFAQNNCFEQVDICLDECLSITKSNEKLLALKDSVISNKQKKSFSDFSEAVEENHEILIIKAIEEMQIKYQILLDENMNLKIQETTLIEALESSNKHSIEIISEKKEKNSQQDATIKNLLDQTQEIQIKYDKKKIVKENKYLTQKNKSLEYLNKSLDQNYEILEDQYKNVVNQKTKLFSEHHELQNNVDNFLNENKGLKKKIQMAETEKLSLEKEKRELLAKLVKSETRNKELEKENKDLKQKILQLQETIKKQGKSIEKLKLNLESLKTEINDLKHKSEKTDETIEEKISEKFSFLIQKLGINSDNTNNSKKSNDDTYTEIQIFQNNK